MNTETVYKPLNQLNLDKNWDVIVIGSGIGGMACAAALSKMGHKVLVLEQHYVAGGYTHVFSRKGFSWDVGVHCLGQMTKRHLPGKLMAWLSNDELQFESLGEVYDEFFFPDGFKIQFPNDPVKFKTVLKAAFPGEEMAIDQYFTRVNAALDTAKTFFALRAMPQWLGATAAKLLGFYSEKNDWMRTTKSVLDEITSNQKLQAVLCSQWGYYGSPPSRSSFALHALTTSHYLRGGYYPVGTSKSIADTFLKNVVRAGGATAVRAPVKEILFEGRRAIGVELESGERFLAPSVVSAAGAKLTAESLLPTNLRDGGWATEIRSLHQSPAYVCLYIGLSGDVQAAGATKANQWYYESWDIEQSVWKIEDESSEAPVLYISFPSLKDPKHKSAGHTMEVVTFVDWQHFDKWKHTRRGHRDADYHTFKQELQNRLMTQVKKHLPKIEKLIQHIEFSTPLSTLFFTRAPGGAIYSLEGTPDRFRSPVLRTFTPYKGLYLAGSDVGVFGVSGALMGGVLAAASIDKGVIRKLMEIS